MRSLSGMNSSAAISTPAKMARPPSSGVASLASPRAFSASTAPMRRARRAATGGVSERRGGERDQEGVEGFALHVQRRGSQGRRRGRGTADRRRIGDCDGGAAGQLDAEPLDPMGDATSAHRRLARAYLALGDDPEPPPRAALGAARRRRAGRGDHARARRAARLGRRRRRTGCRPTSPPRRRAGKAAPRAGADDDDGDGGDALEPTRRDCPRSPSRRRGSARTARPTWGLDEGDAIAPGPHRAAPPRRRPALRGVPRLGRPAARRARREGAAARTRRPTRPRCATSAARPTRWRGCRTR